MLRHTLVSLLWDITNSWVHSWGIKHRALGIKEHKWKMYCKWLGYAATKACQQLVIQSCKPQLFTGWLVIWVFKTLNIMVQNCIKSTNMQLCTLKMLIFSNAVWKPHSGVWMCCMSMLLQSFQKISQVSAIRCEHCMATSCMRKHYSCPSF